MKDSNRESFVSAYKEKMKELSMLSLICSCFYPEPRNINIYTYDGELTPGMLLPARSLGKLGSVRFSLTTPDIIKSVSGMSHY